MSDAVSEPKTTSQNASTDGTAPAAGRFEREQTADAARAGGKPARSIVIEGVEAWYGDRHAIRELSLGFEPNKATALIGPSGSGKSTVVRCINRMHEEQVGGRAAGKVLLDGQDVYGSGVDVVAVRRAIGMVFQSPIRFRRCRSSTTWRRGCG